MGEAYDEVAEALENLCSDHHLEADFYPQLKGRIQLIGESLEKFAVAIDHLAGSAHVDLTEYPISKEVARTLPM
jgi:hypothetical protein